MIKNYLCIILMLCFFSSFAQDAPFITTWQVTNDDLSIEVPIGEGIFDYTIDFGDGTVLSNVSTAATHTYETAGTYTVSISGNFPAIQFSYMNTDVILSIEQWGDITWETFEEAFTGRTEMVLNATDTPNLSQVTSLEYMFYDCDALTTNTAMNTWNVSTITNMQGVFQACDNFNQLLDNWDVSNVVNMAMLFDGASVYNQPLDNWDVSNVEDMSYMFANASSFNQPLNSWVTSSLTNVYAMFWNATSFNQSLDNWDVSNVTGMDEMFLHASSFNGALNAWDVSNVEHMWYMFSETSSFNQPLDTWDVSNVTQMGNMFSNATSFNQPLNSWNVEEVTNMMAMFRNASNFNQPLEAWDVSNVNDMTNMFSEASAFNQDLSDWDFNQNLNVTNYGNENSGFLYLTSLSVENYDALLARFAELQITGNTMKANGLQYCDESSRNYLVYNLGWTITGDQLSDDCAMEVDTMENNSLVQVYPNPASYQIQVSLPTSTTIQSIAVYTAQGKLVHQGTATIIAIDKLPVGIYLVEIETNSGIVIRRFVKK